MGSWPVARTLKNFNRGIPPPPLPGKSGYQKRNQDRSPENPIYHITAFSPCQENFDRIKIILPSPNEEIKRILDLNNPNLGIEIQNFIA